MGAMGVGAGGRCRQRFSAAGAARAGAARRLERGLEHVAYGRMGYPTVTPRRRIGEQRLVLQWFMRHERLIVYQMLRARASARGSRAQAGTVTLLALRA